MSMALYVTQIKTTEEARPCCLPKFYMLTVVCSEALLGFWLFGVFYVVVF